MILFVIDLHVMSMLSLSINPLDFLSKFENIDPEVGSQLYKLKDSMAVDLCSNDLSRYLHVY